MSQIQEAGVSGILIDNNSALVIHRAPYETEQAWEFVKGKVEFGEDPADAIVREYEEEVGLSIKIVEILGILSWQYSRDEDNYHIVETVYMVKLSEEKDIHSLKLSPDHDEYRWVSIGELNQLQPMIESRRGLLASVLSAKK